MSLYQILIDYLDKVPETLLQYHGKQLLVIKRVGYEALVGMLKWAIPINPETTLAHLMTVFYKEICLK